MGSESLPVVALFAGEPGTGKSLAAEVVAADLGLDLFKVDLAQTVRGRQAIKVSIIRPFQVWMRRRIGTFIL